MQNAEPQKSEKPLAGHATRRNMADHVGVRRWVKQAGGRLDLPDDEPGVEVSPLVSYAGEGLEPLCNQRTFRQAFDIFLQVGLCAWSLPCSRMLVP